MRLYCLGQAKDSPFYSLYILTVMKQLCSFSPNREKSSATHRLAMMISVLQAACNRRPQTSHFSIHPHFPKFFPSLPLPPFLPFKSVLPRFLLPLCPEQTSFVSCLSCLELSSLQNVLQPLRQRRSLTFR